MEVLFDVREKATIYYVGYALSLVALIIALWIFLYFKDLRCVRNTIHTNLVVTYILSDLTWIITATLQSNPAMSKASCYSTIILTYFIGTNFFWMFVEGLYLYILVVKTFSIELVKIQNYLFIGWCLPLLLVTIWGSVKYYWSNYSVTESGHFSSSCLWQINTRDMYDYIFICPVILVLLFNIFFLGKVMYVLITKLRINNTAESKQYRKAAKALLVLIPLLGVTYLLLIVSPTQRTARIVFTYLQAALFSTQGFTVAVLYCFMNAEVRNSVRHHFERWKNQRAMRSGEYPTAMQSRSYAFRSTRYGEGMKFYRPRCERNNRGSCISFTTSTTYVGSSTYHQNLNRTSVSRQPSNGPNNAKYSPVTSPQSEDIL
ncbi:Diuretic hormone receptor [Halotydeus destructor]|nr:Diuretic hormone receptor [Halotydeus destructor]